MIVQTQGNIFLADQRGCTQLDWFRSFHTFNFGSYSDINREPFGILKVVNDETLRGQRSITMNMDEPVEAIIIPIVGTLDYQDNMGNNLLLEVGSVQCISAEIGTEYTITNPYEDDLVNYLHILIKMNEAAFNSLFEQKSIDFAQKNQLHSIFNENKTEILGFMGIYDGREEELYTLKKTKTGIFAFVIAGVFEIQNRLLHERDSLTLWNTKEVDFEALSNDAVILLFEIPILGV